MRIHVLLFCKASISLSIPSCQLGYFTTCAYVWGSEMVDKESKYAACGDDKWWKEVNWERGKGVPEDECAVLRVCKRLHW